MVKVKEPLLFFCLCCGFLASTASNVVGIENHPVDPEPKPNLYCESGVSKMVQSVHRDDRLKMTIKRTQSPVSSDGQFSHMGEKRDDGIFFMEFLLSLYIMIVFTAEFELGLPVNF